MNKILKIVILLMLVILPIKVSAAEKVDLYIFYSDSCPHCTAERKFLATIEDSYKDLNIHYYEVSKNVQNNKLMSNVKEAYLQNGGSVPFTVIGKRSFTGYNESLSADIKSKIESCIKEGCYDYVKDIIKGKKVNLSEEKSESFNVPILGNISAKDVSLPLIAVVIGLVDGFNPCAMWILIFLISMLIGMKDKKRMWILGFTFLITSAVVYLLFMISWLNITVNFTQINWIRNVIALISLTGAFINLKSYFKAKDVTGCEVTDDKKRKKIIHRIKDIVREKSFFVAIIGIMVLAFSVNLVELACSAGLPLLFTQILAINDLSNLEYMMYMFIYIFFFLLDDLIVFYIAMFSLKITGISTKYTKLSHLIGGIIMFIIGVLLLLKPEWLMFNI